MKAIPFKITKEDDNSIKVQVDQGLHFYDKLHYHPDVQVTAIIKGKGIVHGGNSMQKFGPGDVIVFGPNMPHLLKNNPLFYSVESPGVLSYSLFFDYHTFGGGLFGIKEMSNISKLIENSKRGIIVNDIELNSKISAAMQYNNEQLVISLLDVLYTINKTEYSFINGDLYNLSLDEKVGNRLNDILEFTFSNIGHKIHVEDVAKVANLSKSQFSRYFKSHTGKSYVQFLNELRIENACAQLLEEKKNIENVCYEVGFQNVSNFNRIFKSIKGISPKAYRVRHTF